MVCNVHLYVISGWYVVERTSIQLLIDFAYRPEIHGTLEKRNSSCSRIRILPDGRRNPCFLRIDTLVNLDTLALIYFHCISFNLVRTATDSDYFLRGAHGENQNSTFRYIIVLNELLMRTLQISSFSYMVGMRLFKKMWVIHGNSYQIQNI